MRFNKQFYILFSCWFLANGFLLHSLGIKYAIDTARFDAEAAAWINGSVEPSYRLWYSGYIAILALCKSIFHSIYPSIFFQYTVSLIATLLFYKGLCNLLKNSQTAFYSTLLTTCYLPIQQWNTCLLTESIFISLILLFVWACSIERRLHKWTAMLLIAGLAATIRPNGGILLITCVGVYSMQSPQPDTKIRVLFTLGIAIFLLILHRYTDTFYQFLLDSFNKSEVICGYNHYTSTQSTYVANDPSSGSLTKTVRLITMNPAKSVQLFTGRLCALWADVRPYYTTIHNLFLAGYLMMAYSMAVIGFIQYRNTFKQLSFATLIYCGLNSLLVMVTYADWDGRFLAPLLPLIFIWSGLGIYCSTQFLKRKKNLL